MAENKVDAEVREVLGGKYYTVQGAAEWLQRENPGKEVNHKQVARAIDNGNLKAEKFGRTRFILEGELKRFNRLLAPTKTEPNKLRLNQSKKQDKSQA